MSKEPITIRRLTEVGVHRSARWHENTHWSLSDWGVALAGEVGEACNIIKKLNRIRDDMRRGVKTHGELLAELGNELADVQIYLPLLAVAAGIDLEEVTRAKFNQVSEKYDFPERL